MSDMGRTGPDDADRGDEPDEPDFDYDLGPRATPSKFERSPTAMVVPVVVLLVLSFVVLYPPWAYSEGRLDLPSYPVCFGLYLLVGMATFVRPLQRLLLAALFGARRPTRNERRKLQPAWQAVRERARVTSGVYLLTVVEDPGPTAVATGGSVMVVTTAAVKHLPQDELEGILAHELGHHVGLHDVALPLAHWLATPIGVLAQVGRLLSQVAILGVAAFAGLIFVGITFIGPLAAAALGVAGLFLVAPGPLAGLLGRMVSRYGEPHADDVAHRLGYGPALDAAYDRFDRLERKDDDKAKEKAARRNVAQRIFADDQYRFRER
jgi:Zn-dependent protease with chaperone function